MCLKSKWCMTVLSQLTRSSALTNWTMPHGNSHANSSASYYHYHHDCHIFFFYRLVLDASGVHSKLQTSEVITSPVFLSSSTPRIRPDLETKQMAVHHPRWQPIRTDGNLKGTNLKIHTVRESTAVTGARLYTRYAVASLYCKWLCFC